MRNARISILATVVTLLVSSEAFAIGCWVCDHALETCLYYRRTELVDCRSGCDRTYPPGSAARAACQGQCTSQNNSGINQCYAEHDWCSDGCDGGDDGPPENCPIVLDLGRNGFQFTSAADGVTFDLDANGDPDSLAWTDAQGGDGFLALDRDRNGRIDSGLELFGNHTPQPPSSKRSGYAALAVYDAANRGGNADGVISAADAVWSDLRVWVDGNHNGVSEPDELTSLDSVQIISIDLDFKESRRKDRYGNELRYRSRVLRGDGPAATDAVDVFFQGIP